MDAKRMLGGWERAKITPKKIRGKCYQANVNQTAAAMQSAFDFYYYSIKAIEAINIPASKSPNARKILEEKKYKLRNNLRRACDKNLNNYDLNWVFEDLARNKGLWYDESSDGWGGGKCVVPIGVANFLYENKYRINHINRKFSEFNVAKSNAMRLLSEGKWGEVAKELSYAQKAADHALPYLWIMVSKNPQKIKPYSELMSKWIGYGADVHKILDDTINYSTNSSQWKQKAITNLSQFVLNKVPVFGQLYSGVIAELPDLVKNFKLIMKQKERYLDKPNNPNGPM